LLDFIFTGKMSLLSSKQYCEVTEGTINTSTTTIDIATTLK